MSCSGLGPRLDGFQAGTLKTGDSVMDEDWEKYKSFALQAESSNNFPIAEGMWAMCVLISEGFDQTDPRLPFSLDRLGHALLKQRKLKLAERFLTQSWNIRGTNPAQNGVEMASTANLLAELYFHEQRYQHAESLCQWVADLYEQCYGKEHQSTVTAVRNLTLVRGAIPKAQPQPVAQQVTDGQQGHNAQQAQSGAHTQQGDAQGQGEARVTKSRMKAVCERCGNPLDGLECLRCTGTTMRVISPLDRLT